MKLRTHSKSFQESDKIAGDDWINFTLIVDDFGVKYKSIEDFTHLKDCFSLRYKMKVDMEAKQYVGIDLQWDYTNRTLDCSMDEYVETASNNSTYFYKL